MKIFVYNLTTAFSKVHRRNDADAFRVYNALLHERREISDDREGILRRAKRLRLGVSERMYADGWLHAHLMARPDVATITPDASAADFFWLPLWDYAACTLADGETGLSPFHAKGRANANMHTQQVAYGGCMGMKFVFLWLFQQPTWRRSHGADHIFFSTFKDRLNRVGRTAHPAAGVRNYSHALIANSVFATTEDRLLLPESRLGCTSIVIPYYADPEKWGGRASSRHAPTFEEMVRAKTRLIAFLGNIRRYGCHLEYEACRAYGFSNKGAGPANADKLRGTIMRSVGRYSDSSVFDYGRRSSAFYHGRDNATLLASTFCPAPCGDVYTSKRLFTAILSLCIPIIISDRIQLPYTGALRWESFSLRLDEDQVINKTVDVVAFAQSIPARRVLELQRALWHARPLLAFNASLDAASPESPHGTSAGAHENAPPRDALNLLMDDIGRTRDCMRPILVRRLGAAPCMHGHSFGLVAREASRTHRMWVAHQCHGLFSLWRKNTNGPGSDCPRERTTGECRVVECGGPRGDHKPRRSSGTVHGRAVCGLDPLRT